MCQTHGAHGQCVRECKLFFLHQPRRPVCFNYTRGCRVSGIPFHLASSPAHRPAEVFSHSLHSWMERWGVLLGRHQSVQSWALSLVRGWLFSLCLCLSYLLSVAAERMVCVHACVKCVCVCPTTFAVLGEEDPALLIFPPRTVPAVEFCTILNSRTTFAV